MYRRTSPRPNLMWLQSEHFSSRFASVASLPFSSSPHRMHDCEGVLGYARRVHDELSSQDQAFNWSYQSERSRPTSRALKLFNLFFLISTGSAFTDSTVIGVKLLLPCLQLLVKTSAACHFPTTLTLANSAVMLPIPWRKSSTPRSREE